MRHVAAVIITSMLMVVNADAACRAPSPHITDSVSGGGFDIRVPEVEGATQFRVEGSLTRNRWEELAFRPFNGPGEVTVYPPVALSTTTFLLRITPLASGGLELCEWIVPMQLEPSLPLRRSLMRLIVPVVGSNQGANGSFFRSSVTLANPTADVLTGRLVFHPAGRVADPTDPSIGYSIPAGGTVLYDDVVTALGGTGLGSLDVIPTDPGRETGAPAAVHAPTIVSRVLGRTGDGAEYGGNVPAVLAEEAIPHVDGLVGVPLGAGTGTRTAHIVVPNDLGDVRLNIGFRTVAIDRLGVPVSKSGARQWFQATLTRGGAVVEQMERSLPREYMEQIPAGSLFTSAIMPGDQIAIESVGTIVYWSLTDNITNDPTVFVAAPAAQATVFRPSLVTITSR